MATQQLNRLAGLLTSAYSANRFTDESDGDLLDRCRTGADPAAFEAIVRRHGGRVLAACRKVLGDSADIDDAFQATFLTLLRNPQAVRKAASLGAWLYGVAHRIAVRARDSAHRRRGLLRNIARPADAVAPDLSWREACTVLHSELDRLPDSLRMPLVLCYLDGLSRDEAAAQLGWSLNEVRGRLERGRSRLRARLEKRGIALSAGLLAEVAGNSVTAGGPPTRFIEIAMRAAAGHSTAAATALANGVHPIMVTTLKIVSAVVLAAGVLVGVGTQRPNALGGPKSSDAKSAQAAASKAAEPAAPPEFAGRVLDPDGKPVQGAKIHFLYYTPKALPVPERAITDADGKFRFTVKADELDRSYKSEPWNAGLVTAHANGFGRGWTPVGGKPDQLTIRLAKDDKPLAGRVVNLEGKPLAGLNVRVIELMGPHEGKDLSAFVADLKKRKSGYQVLRTHATGFEGTWLGRDVGTLFPLATTDSDGRFRIPGVGTDRIATVRFESPAVESRVLRVLTREAETVTVPEWNGDRAAPDQPSMTFVGNDFTYALAPGRTVTGVVTDKSTGKPIAGAVIVSERIAGNAISGRQDFRTVADKDGKFAMYGLPLGRGTVLRAGPPAGQPYLMQYRDVPVPSGTNPAPLDFELTRGVELTVKVTDTATKAPIAGWIEYFTYPDNPAYVAIKGFAAPDRQDLDSADGVFRLVVPSGPGLVAFRARVESYPVAVGAEQFKDRMSRAFINTVPHLCHPTTFTALAPVDPKPAAQTAEVQIVLNAGKTVTGKVLDPDGKPLTGVRARGLKSAPLVFGVWDEQPLRAADFEAVALDPKRPRSLVFLHPEKKLGGAVRMTGDEKVPIEVKLRPWATVTGRLVDADGKPVANVRLGFVMNLDEPDPAGVGDLPDREVRTDAAGRFTIGGFVPGLRYNLVAIDSTRVLANVTRRTQFKEGETKDVGDVVMKPVGE